MVRESILTYYNGKHFVEEPKIRLQLFRAMPSQLREASLLRTTQLLGNLNGPLAML